MDACGDVLGVSAPCRFMIVGAAGLPAAGEAVLASAGGDARSDLDSALAAPALLLTVAALRCERSARGGTGGVSIRISSAATFGPGAAGLVAENSALVAVHRRRRWRQCPTWVRSHVASPLQSRVRALREMHTGAQACDSAAAVDQTQIAVRKDHLAAEPKSRAREHAGGHPQSRRADVGRLPRRQMPRARASRCNRRQSDGPSSSGNSPDPQESKR